MNILAQKWTGSISEDFGIDLYMLLVDTTCIQILSHCVTELLLSWDLLAKAQIKSLKHFPITKSFENIKMNC